MGEAHPQTGDAHFNFAIFMETKGDMDAERCITSEQPQGRTSSATASSTPRLWTRGSASFASPSQAATSPAFKGQASGKEALYFKYFVLYTSTSRLCCNLKPSSLGCTSSIQVRDR